LASRDVTLSEPGVSRRSFWAEFLRDRRGVVGVAVAVLLPVLVGFAGIGIEVGLWFAVQRQNQSAADAAAISAGLEYAAQIESGVTTNPTAAAATTANYNLFSTTPPNTLTLHPCYAYTVGSSCNTSPSNGPLDAVQVVLTQPLNTTFANFVTAIWGPNINLVTVRTTAIAAFPMLPGGQTCLLAVGSSQTVSMGGSATLNLPNCTLASLSILGNSIQLPGSGNPAINAAAIATAGNVQMADGGSPPPHTFTYFPLQDPYKNVTTTPLNGSIPLGPCNSQDPKWNSGNPPVSPKTLYCGLTISGTAIVNLPLNYYIGNGGLTINGSAQVTLGGGIYYIGGDVNISDSPTVTFGPGLYYLYGGNFIIRGLTGGSFTGSGITIVLTATPGTSAGGIDIDTSNACTANIRLSGTQTGQGLLQLSATGSQGLLFFQDPTAVGPNTPPSNILTTGASDPSCGTSNVTLNGAIYTPASSDNLQGNALANVAGCTEFIFRSFNFSGNPELDDTGCSAVGITLNQAQIQEVYLAM
jgi:Flp pilus assembly protein TadG